MSTKIEAYHLARTQPSFREEHSEIKTLNFIESKFFKTRVEEPFFKELAPLLNRPTVEIFDTQLVQEPNNIALQNICNHYQTKYGITIRVVSSSSLATVWNELKSQTNKPFYIGLIIKDGRDRLYGHVCPLLCHFTQEKEETYIMDVLGDDYPFDFMATDQCHKPVSSELERIQGVTYQIGVKQENIFSAKGKRQVDSNSCRIGAVTILRNALLWIKKNATPEESLKSILQKLKTDQTPYKIPLEWTYTEQIYPKTAELSQIPVIRDFFSSKKKERTIQQFRDEHSKDGTFECTLTLPISIKIPSPVPDDITIKEFGLFELFYTVTIPGINRYLQEKGIAESKRMQELNRN